MSGPAFEEGVAHGNSRIRCKGDSRHGIVDPSPTSRAKFTESICFGGESLQIEKNVTLSFTGAPITRRKCSGIFRLACPNRFQTLAHSICTEDQVSWQTDRAVLCRDFL